MTKIDINHIGIRLVYHAEGGYYEEWEDGDCFYYPLPHNGVFDQSFSTSYWKRKWEEKL